MTVDAKATLRFTYVGFKTQDIPVNGKTVFNVVMEENSELLDVVVVVGYGTMDKKELTSAISHVGEKDFLTVSSLDPSMMIQGKVPGVSITNTEPGDPNNQASIQIRGVSSRSAGLGPLIVIDGVPEVTSQTLILTTLPHSISLKTVQLRPYMAPEVLTV